MTEPDWTALRGRFPLLRQKTYMNSCSYGLLSTEVENAFLAYLDDCRRFGSHWDFWVGEYEALRSDFAALLGAMPAEIAVTASASAGINAVASALDFSGPRRKIVITDFEFPTSGQIWHAQAARGAQIERVIAGNPQTMLERLSAAVDETTLLVAATHICYRNGAKLDVGAIADIAKAKGALVLIDGFQAVGATAFDVSTSNIDFYAGGALKYLLGAAGVGFLYARAGATDALSPAITGWFAQEDIAAMDHTRHNPARTARRFEAGTPPVPNVYAARAGLKVIAQASLPMIEKRNAMLTQRIIDGAMAQGFSIATPTSPREHGPLIAIRARDAENLVAALLAEGIITSSRDGNIRLSPHFYNDECDVDKVLDALRRNRSLLG